MKIEIRLMCDQCGKFVFAARACAWTDYVVEDWSSKIICKECNEQP